MAALVAAKNVDSFNPMMPGNLFSLMKICRLAGLCQMTSRRLGAVLALTLILPLCPHTLVAEEQTFASPQEAVNTLLTAARNHDTNALHTIFGPVGRELISPDVVQAGEDYQLFVQRLTEKTILVTNASQPIPALSLKIGADGWPFPIPLVQENGRWHFDTAAGKEEILARRIGRDELGAINVCNAYVQAQREYASQDQLGDGVLAYARFLRSTTGTHDGLFWPAKTGEDLSPLGPLIAQARVEGYHHTATMLDEKLAPYHGYYFKILTRQGRHAPGGKYDYLINGRMIAGFALVAWPAEWGNTGIMTFIVNQQGKVWQKNLGARTAKTAAALTTYDPDDTWTPAQ
jgi:hypothetical protein